MRVLDGTGVGDGPSVRVGVKVGEGGGVHVFKPGGGKVGVALTSGRKVEVLLARIDGVAAGAAAREVGAGKGTIGLKYR